MQGDGRRMVPWTVLLQPEQEFQSDGWIEQNTQGFLTTQHGQIRIKANDLWQSWYNDKSSNGPHEDRSCKMLITSQEKWSEEWAGAEGANLVNLTYVLHELPRSLELTLSLWKETRGNGSKPEQSVPIYPHYWPYTTWAKTSRLIHKFWEKIA